MMYPFVKPKKLYRISEILEHLEKSARIRVSRQTLHNYTMLGLINETTRTSAGHRMYAENVFNRLIRIEMLKRHHTLREIKELIIRKSKAKRR